MTVRPVSPKVLPEVLADLLLDAVPGPRRLRVAVDGAPAAGPGTLADALVPPLAARGLPALRVRAGDYLRPASVRFERGRTDDLGYAEDWLDVRGLQREVLAPLGPGGDGRWLPSLWDPVRDRATRAAYAAAPERCVLLLDGPLLLGRRLDLDLTVHLHLSAGALRRRTPPAEAWTLPAYDRYAAAVRPLDTADVVVRVDDPRRPALQVSARAD